MSFGTGAEGFSLVPTPKFLWHQISHANLLKKISFGQKYRGRLWLQKPDRNKDVSDGALGEFLYCLPSPLGAPPFVGKEEKLCEIRLEISPKSRWAYLQDIADKDDWRRLQGLFSGVYQRVEAKALGDISFQHWILWDAKAVVRWSYDEETLEQQCRADIEKIARGQVKNGDLFLPDLSWAEQLWSALETYQRYSSPRANSDLT